MARASLSEGNSVRYARAVATWRLCEASTPEAPSRYRSRVPHQRTNNPLTASDSRAATETAEKVGFDDFRIQDTGVEKIQLQYFVGEIPDFGLFQQSPTGR
jgi:hypothetical protein